MAALLHGLVVSPALAGRVKSQGGSRASGLLGSRGRRGARGIAALQIYTVRNFPADWNMT